MSLDDLLKGLAAFDSGLQRFGTSQAIRKANEEREDIEMQGLREQERLDKMTDLSQDLAMKLAAIGAPGNEIQAATAFAPTVAAQYQAAQNRKLAEEARNFNRSESEKDRRFQRKRDVFRAEIDLLLAGAKNKAKQISLGSGFQYLGDGGMDPVVARDAQDKLGAAMGFVDAIDDSLSLIRAKGMSAFGEDAAEAQALALVLTGETGKNLIDLGALSDKERAFIETVTQGGWGWNLSGNAAGKAIKKLETIRRRVVRKSHFYMDVRQIGIPDGKSRAGRMLGTAVSAFASPQQARTDNAFKQWRTKHRAKLISNHRLASVINEAQIILEDPDASLQTKRNLIKYLKDQDIDLKLPEY